MLQPREYVGIERSISHKPQYLHEARMFWETFSIPLLFGLVDQPAKYWVRCMRLLWAVEMCVLIWLNTQPCIDTHPTY